MSQNRKRNKGTVSRKFGKSQVSANPHFLSQMTRIEVTEPNTKSGGKKEKEKSNPTRIQEIYHAPIKPIWLQPHTQTQKTLTFREWGQLSFLMQRQLGPASRNKHWKTRNRKIMRYNQ